MMFSMKNYATCIARRLEFVRQIRSNNPILTSSLIRYQSNAAPISKQSSIKPNSNSIQESKTKTSQIQNAHPININSTSIESESKNSKPIVQYSQTVCLVGSPNAGKSSIINQLLGSVPLASVSNKINTTSQEMLGIISKGNTHQLKLYDTPGIYSEINSKKYYKSLSSIAYKSISNSQTVCVIIDSVKKITSTELSLMKRLNQLKKLHESISNKQDTLSSSSSSQSNSTKSNLTKSNPPNKFRIILILNKIDLCSPMRDIRLQKLIDQCNQFCEFDYIFKTIATTGQGCNELLTQLFNDCIKREWEHSKNDITDLSISEKIENVIKSHLYNRFQQELPYTFKQKTKEIYESNIIEPELLADYYSKITKYKLSLKELKYKKKQKKLLTSSQMLIEKLKKSNNPKLKSKLDELINKQNQEEQLKQTHQLTSILQPNSNNNNSISNSIVDHLIPSNELTLYVHQIIICKNCIHQSIVNGSKGSILKSIQELSQSDLQLVFRRPVVLKLTTQVAKKNSIS